MTSELLLTVVGFAAIAVMLFNVYLVMAIRRQASGGIVGKRWAPMSLLVVLFALGYLILPFLGALPPETLRLIVSLIFFFGAIYVLITLRLIQGIIAELSA